MAIAQDYPCKIPNVNSVTCEKGQQAHCIPKGDKTWDVECTTVLSSSKNTDQSLGEAGATLQRSNARYSATARVLATTPDLNQTSYCHPLGGFVDSYWRKEDEAEWRRKVHEEPNDEGKHYHLGQILLANNKLPEAEKEFRFLVDRERPNTLAFSGVWPSALSALGVTLFEQGRYAEAEDAFKKKYELEDLFRRALSRTGFPYLPDSCSLYLLALAQAARHNYADAEDTIRKSGLRGDYTSSYLLLASVLYDQGKFPESEVAYRKVLTFTESIPKVTDLTSQYPEVFSRLTAQEGLIATLLKQGKYADAASLTGPMLIGRSTAWRIFEIGLTRLNQGKYIEAERILRQAVALDSTNMIFWETLEIVKAKK